VIFVILNPRSFIPNRTQPVPQNRLCPCQPAVSRGLGETRKEPQSRDRRGADRGVLGYGLAAIRGRRTQAHRGQDRGRPGYREPEGFGALGV